MKREDLEAKEFGLIIASSNFPFYAAPEADAVMDAMEARIKELEADAELDQKKRLTLCEGYNRKCERVKELEAENERLKGELKETHKTEVKELLCLISDKEKRFNRAFESEEKEIRRQKYKRCLAMAEWCDAEADVADADGDYDDMRWYQKWHTRWLDLAKKLKEGK